MTRRRAPRGATKGRRYDRSCTGASENREKTAVIFEGGSMRCQFTAGVIDVLLEQGIEVDACFGVSAGA